MGWAELGSMLPSWGRSKRARRNVLGGHIGVGERIEHGPQHVAFKLKRGEHALLAFRRERMAPHVSERKVGIALGLGRALVKIPQDLRSDEAIVRQHPGNPLADN